MELAICWPRVKLAHTCRCRNNVCAVYCCQFRKFDISMPNTGELTGSLGRIGNRFQQCSECHHRFGTQVPTRGELVLIGFVKTAFRSGMRGKCSPVPANLTTPKLNVFDTKPALNSRPRRHDQAPTLTILRLKISRLCWWPNAFEAEPTGR